METSISKNNRNRVKTPYYGNSSIIDHSELIKYRKGKTRGVS